MKKIEQLNTKYQYEIALINRWYEGSNSYADNAQWEDYNLARQYFDGLKDMLSSVVYQYSTLHKFYDLDLDLNTSRWYIRCWDR